MPRITSDERRLLAARQLFEHLGKALQVPVSVRLWDGSLVPLGAAEAEAPVIAVAGPEVLGALLRRPSLDRLFRQYVLGGLALEGGDLLAFFDLARDAKKTRKLKLADLRRGLPWGALLPLWSARRAPDGIAHQVAGAEQGRARSGGDDKALIQFHYDVSATTFYELFLDREMVYSCGYFTDWSNSLDQAQEDKLDLICRKLRLQAGRALSRHRQRLGRAACATRRGTMATKAHGVTLSQAQFDLRPVEKIESGSGSTERVSGGAGRLQEPGGAQYDKIASHRHVRARGDRQLSRPTSKKIRGLLEDDGLSSSTTASPAGPSARSRSSARSARASR